MAHHSRQEDRERLKREIQSEDYRGLLKDMQSSEPMAGVFSTWEDVVRFMHDAAGDSSVKDALLRAIFRAHRKDFEPRWRTLLLVMFWPALESIHWKKRHWDADPEERWQNLVWTFLRVVCKIDPDRRPQRLPTKIVNDTVHHLWDEYRRVLERAKRELPMDEESLAELAGGTDDIDYSGINQSMERGAQVERLRAHVAYGNLNNADFLLLVGTRVYGEALADYARRQGIGYQTAKKRRQRAEAAIRLSVNRGQSVPECDGQHPFLL